MIRVSNKFHSAFRGFLFGVAFCVGLLGIGAWIVLPLVAALGASYWHEDHMKRD